MRNTIQIGAVSASLLTLVVGFSAAGADPAKVVVEFRLADKEPTEGSVAVSAPGWGGKLYLRKKVEITNADIAETAVGLDGEVYKVMVRFTKDGAEKMSKLSERNRGGVLAILVDGKVVFAPRIDEKITERAAIAGGLTRDKAERIANGIGGK